MDMELTDVTIKKLAHAMVLAPHEIVAEGTANWTPGDKYDFTQKAEGQPLEKQVSIYLAMRGRADAAATSEAEKAAARAARAPEEKAEFDTIRRQAQERADASAATAKEARAYSDAIFKRDV